MWRGWRDTKYNKIGKNEGFRDDFPHPDSRGVGAVLLKTELERRVRGGTEDL